LKEALLNRLLVAGHSHTLALLEGFENEVDQGSFSSRYNSMEVSIIAEWRGAFVQSSGTINGTRRAVVRYALPKTIEDTAPSRVALMWWGNQMNVRALLLDGPRFDIASTPEFEGPVDPLVQLIPRRVVEGFVRSTLEQDKYLHEVLRRSADVGAEICLLGPPPPLPDIAVRERLAQSPHFVRVLNQANINLRDAVIVEASVRRRLRNILLDVYNSFAGQFGASFIPPPTAVADENGLLQARYWTDDVTHANAQYGAMYVRDVMDWALGGR
jgi:hypothetical protein